MLLSLLPLAGWAEAFENVRLTKAIPTVYTEGLNDSYTYENFNKGYVDSDNQGTQLSEGDVTITLQYLTALDEEAPSDWTGATTPSAVTAAGWYKMTVTASDENSITSWAEDARGTNGVYVFKVAKAANSISNLTLDDWEWEATPTTHTPTSTSAFGSPEYTYSADGTTYGTYDDQVNGVIGNYFVKATVAATQNYDGAVEVLPFSIKQATIAENDITAPTASDVTYDGTPKALHTLGSVANSYGTIKFATSENAADSEWSTEAITGTNAGGYTVYYKIFGDANHKNTNPLPIADTKVKQVDLTISARSRTFGYTGNTIANTEFFTISSGSLISDDAENTALINSLVTVGWVGSATQPVNANATGWQFALTAGNPQNYKVTIGTANGSLIITKQSIKAIVGNIANYTYGSKLLSTSDFNTTYKTLDNANLSVTPKSISYTILRNSDSQNYFVLDDEDKPTTTVKGDVGTYTVTPVVEFDNYVVEDANITKKTFTVSQATLNANWISLSENTYEYDGQSNEHMPVVTVNNGVSYPNGKTVLVVGTDYTLTEPTDKVNAGEKTITISATGNYKNPTGGANTKKYNITKAALTILVSDQTKEWDGEAIEDVQTTKSTSATKLDKFVTIYNDLDEDYDEVFKLGESTKYPVIRVVKKNVGTASEPVYDNTYAGEYEITIVEDSYNARNYDVMIENGTMTIGTPSIKIKAKNAEKIYGAADPAAFEYEVYVGSSATAVSDPSVYVKTAPTSITREDASQNTVGTYTITCSQDAVLQDNYSSTTPTYETGTFTIKKAQLRILAKAASKVYDGQEPAASTLEYTAVGLKYNDAVTSVKLVKDAGTDVGQYTITASDAVVTNAAQYDIKYQTAKYEITRRALTKISVADQSIAKQDANETANKDAALATLDKTKVTFTADGYTLSAADYQKLQSEFKFVFGTAVNVSTATFDGTTNTPINNAIKIAYEDAEKKFTNFSLPKVSSAADAAEINLNSAATINNKYELGKLSIFVAVAALELDDAATAEGTTVAEKIDTYKGQNVTAVTVKLNRNQVLSTTNCNWAAEKWNTMVLPFDVTIRELSAQLGYAIVNVVDAANTTADNVAFKLQMAGTIPANTPFVVKTDVAIPNETELTFANKTIVEGTPSVDAGQGYKFVGCYATKTLGGEENDHSKLSFLRGNGDKWAHIGANNATIWNIVPLAAYVDLTPADNAREITFTMQEVDGTTTVIRNISAETSASINGTEGWYNLNGVKMQGAPTEKGIYIKDGKKVVVK